MYVLHHADQPELYSGLAPDPHISLLVQAWKGRTKPLALAVMALTALAGFFHFVRVGPNEVDERDEAAARQALEAAQRAPGAGAPPGANPPQNRNPEPRP
jgi:formate dehydrogenase iron-sulfur subunit